MVRLRSDDPIRGKTRFQNRGDAWLNQVTRALGIAPAQQISRRGLAAHIEEGPNLRSRLQLLLQSVYTFLGVFGLKLEIRKPLDQIFIGYLQSFLKFLGKILLQLAALLISSTRHYFQIIPNGLRKRCQPLVEYFLPQRLGLFLR